MARQLRWEGKMQRGVSALIGVLVTQTQEAQKACSLRKTSEEE